MMKLVGIVVLTILFSFGVLTNATTTEKGISTKPQTHCPVLNEPIDKKVFIDHNGKRIYFCCSGCIENFKKNPEKYLEKMEKQGIKLEDMPSAK